LKVSGKKTQKPRKKSKLTTEGKERKKGGGTRGGRARGGSGRANERQNGSRKGADNNPKVKKDIPQKKRQRAQYWESEKKEKRGKERIGEKKEKMKKKN